MKKLLFVLSVLFMSLGYAQETKTTVEKSFEEVLKPYVTKALDAAQKGAEFLVDETPIVIQQYIMFESTRYWMIIILGLLFMSLIRYWATNQFLIKTNDKPAATKGYHDYRLIRPNRWLKIDTDNNDYSAMEVWYKIVGYSTTVAGAIIIISNIANAIKVTFFPKLYLVEKFIYLVS